MSLLPWKWNLQRERAARNDVADDAAAALARAERIARRNAADEAARNPSMLLTTRSAPLYYLPITKCGCTFVKNLLYALDHGVEHPDGINVHQTESGLIHADGHDYRTVFDSPYGFTVLRDPPSRFMSFYFDKIWGEGAVNFPRIRAQLEEDGVVDLDRDLGVEAHRANAYRLLDWVARNLQGETDIAVNYHWRAQTGRLRRARMFRLNHLTLDGLDWQLPLLLEPIVPDMAERMEAIRARNRSEKPISAGDVLDADLTKAIQTLYRADTILHDRARRRWLSQTPERRMGAPARPPMFRHRRVDALALPGNVTLTGAAGSGADTVLSLLGQADLVRGTQDLLLHDLGAGDRTAFVLLRDPVERFVAVYADMLGRPRRSPFRTLRMTLIRRRNFVARPKSAEEHAANLLLLVTYMRRRKEDFLDTQAFAPTRLQSHAVGQVLRAGATPVFADRLAHDLARHLARPDLVEPLAAISASLRLPPDILAAITPEVAEAVRNLYRADCTLYDDLRRQAEPGVAGNMT